ncbi:hypothetical protein NIES4106_40250 [Fischerella sp. NIES-4106]|nr:hypothetical protein NIES4106_40250 [Fischerella sp. NIES-4106]
MISYVVVFDTNTLFSGLGWRGSPYRCLELARNGQVSLPTARSSGRSPTARRADFQ